MNKKILTALCCMALQPACAQKLSITKTTVDCGRTAFMAPITAEFEIKNKGLRHLTISEIKTDCGCTKAELPKKSLGPGDKYTLRLTYDARMLGHFEKQAAIYSNGSKKPVYVKMQGVVLAELEDYSGSYPYTLGDLMTNRDQLEFDDVNKGDRPELVINLMNNTSKSMRPNILHLPDYLTALAIPETLEPGRHGTLTLTLNSEKIHSFGLTQTSVYLASNLGDKVSRDNELPVSVVLLPDMKKFDGKAKQFAPKMQLSADHIDVGMIEGKLKKSETITITNKGRTPLNITSMQMFTPGLKVTLDKRELQAGEETKLKIVADRSRLQKARQKPRILMITNDPDHAKVVININVH
jgi:hypothetical protein